MAVKKMDTNRGMGMKISKKQKKQMVLVLFVVVLLFCGMLLKELFAAKTAIEEGLLRGRSQTDVLQETFVLEGADGSRQEVDVTVYPRALSESEQKHCIEKAIEELEDVYLGENDSPEQVYQDLIFPTVLCNGLVVADYTTSHPQLIWEDGSVDEHIDGQVVSIQATLSCQETVVEYLFSVKVVEPILSKEEQEKQMIADAIAWSEENSRDKERFLLPKTILGQPVTWHKKLGAEPFYILLLGIVAVIAMTQKAKQEERKCRERRERQLLMEYPQMVTQLALLMGSGMNLTTAWERMVRRYLAEHESQKTTSAVMKSRFSKPPVKQLYLEEMVHTYVQIRDGMGSRQALEEFASRVCLASYRKMIALLLQNMDKGNRELVSLLDAEAQHAIDAQRNCIRRQGEEAGTKLLFPMLLLFVMVLVIVMVPAVLSF